MWSPGEGVAEGVLVSGQQHPDEVGVGDVAHLRLAKDSVLRRDGDVGGEGEPRCRAERPAVDRADDGLGILPASHLVSDAVAVARAPRVQELGDGLALAEAVGPDDGGLGAVATATHVCAGGESAARAGEDDVADAVVLLSHIERGVEIGPQLDAEGVHGLRPVEGDEHAVLLRLIEDVFVCGGHGVIIPFLLG